MPTGVRKAMRAVLNSGQGGSEQRTHASDVKRDVILMRKMGTTIPRRDVMYQHARRRPGHVRTGIGTRTERMARCRRQCMVGTGSAAVE